MPIRDYSQTAASNTAISSINIGEGCPPSNINDAIRQALADIREVQANATIASAATCNIGAANAEYLSVSGTTTITAFDSVAAGVHRVLKFDGALTLTHNATSLILPTSASIATAANDVAGFRSLGSGNWRCEFYTRADGSALGSSVATAAEIKTASNNTKTVTPAGLANAVGGAWVSVASAATVDLGAQTVANVQVTGTTTITSFGTTDSGVTRQLRFSGALTLTHNATSLILPGAASITTAANDVATAISLGSGNWVVTNYERASGQPVAQRIVQRVYDEERAYSNNTGYTFIPADDTKPTISEGVEILSASITPTSASNRIRVRAVIPHGLGGTGRACLSIHRGSGDALATTWQFAGDVGWSMTGVVEMEEASPGTSPVTYSVRLGASSSAVAFEIMSFGGSGARRFGGAAAASLIVEEIVP